MLFYDYPSWRTGDSPFVPQVTGYLKTHIIHSFLTILNYKTVCACRSSIMFLISLRHLNFHNAPLVKKKTVKRSFQFSWFTNRMWLHYDEANDLAYCCVCMLLTETESWTVRILIKRSYSMDNGFSNWKDGLSKHDSSRCHCDSVRGRNSYVQYVCVVRCSNVTINRNISSNIPTNLTEFINWNCTQDAIKCIYSLSEPKSFLGEIHQTPFMRGGLPLSCSPHLVPKSRAFGTQGMLSVSHGRTPFQKPVMALSLGWMWKVVKKAMIRSRYNRVPHPTPNTKRDKHNQDGI